MFTISERKNYLFQLCAAVICFICLSSENTFAKKNNEQISKSFHTAITKTVGIGGDFTTLKQAFDSINAGIFSNSLTLLLTDAAYSEPQLALRQDSVFLSSLTITSSPGNVATITIHYSNLDFAALKVNKIPQFILSDVILQYAPSNHLYYALSVFSDTTQRTEISNVIFKGSIELTGNISFALHNSELHTNDNVGIKMFIWKGDVVIQGNKFFGYGNTTNGIYGIAKSHNFLIENNTFAGFITAGIYLHDFQDTTGSALQESSFVSLQTEKEQKHYSPAKYRRRTASKINSDQFKHTQSLIKKNTEGGLLSIRNNTISVVGAQELCGGIYVHFARTDNIEISHNNITSETYNKFGILVYVLDSCQFITADSNTINKTNDGIRFDNINNDNEDFVAKLSMQYNSLEVYVSGIQTGEMIGDAIISNNTVTGYSASVSDVGIFTYLEGRLMLENNVVSKFYTGFNLDPSGHYVIRNNTVSDAGLGIYLNTYIHFDTLIIDNNKLTVNNDEVGIYLESEFIGASPQSFLSISRNTIETPENQTVYSAIYTYDIYVNHLSIDSNIIRGEFEHAFAFENIEGINDESSILRKARSNRDEYYTPLRANALQRIAERKSKKVFAEKLPKHKRGEQHQRKNIFPSVTESVNSLFEIKNNIIELNNASEDGTIYFNYVKDMRCDIKNNSISTATPVSYGVYSNEYVNVPQFNFIGNTFKNYISPIYLEIEFDEEDTTTSVNISDNTFLEIEGDGIVFNVYSLHKFIFSNNQIIGKTNTSNNTGLSFNVESISKINMEYNKISNFDNGLEIEAGSDKFYFSNNEISQNANGGLIYYYEYSENGEALFEHNLIQQNSENGIELYVDEDIFSLFRFNKVINNGNDGLIMNETNLLVINNSFYGNGNYDFRYESYADGINAQYNWWGTATTFEMDTTPFPGNIAKIYDVFDHSDYGFVDYNHWMHDTNFTIQSLVVGKSYLDCFTNTCGILPNVKIYLTGAKTDSAVTNASGDYMFYALPTGNYTVRQRTPDGWNITYPQSGEYNFTVDTNGTIIVKNFGYFKYGSVGGKVFHDKNGNGIKNPEDSTLANWKVYISGLINDSTVTDSAGNYHFENLIPGQYHFTVDLSHSWFSSTHPYCDYINIYATGTNVTGLNFGIYRASSISGNVYHDFNHNGISDSTDVVLSNKSVNITGGDINSTIQTDSSGYFEFLNLPIRSYIITTYLQPRWLFTFPLNGKYYATTTSNSHLGNLYFGHYNQVPSTISGFIFNDVDSNGAKGPNEPYLSNWGVRLSGNAIDTVFTDSSGYFHIDSIYHGIYYLHQFPKPGWILTAPAAGQYYFYVNWDSNSYHNKNFGNHRLPLSVTENDIPKEFSLKQNYPNPFNPTTDFKFQIAEQRFVSLKVFDILGEEVATIVNEDLLPGNYSVSWNASNFPSGIYFYRLNAGTFSAIKKLVLTK